MVGVKLMVDDNGSRRKLCGLGVVVEYDEKMSWFVWG